MRGTDWWALLSYIIPPTSQFHLNRTFKYRMKELHCMNDTHYDVAQVCMNGHVTNARFREQPIHNKKYCRDCGAKTITECQECNEQIRGKLVPDPFDMIGFSNSGPADPAPNYCIECGKPYPWTQGKIAAFRELVNSSHIESDKKKVLLEGVEHIISATPKTKPTCARLVSIVSKESLLKNILLDIAVKQAKEVLEILWAGAPLI